jgi:ribosomal protein L11
MAKMKKAQNGADMVSKIKEANKNNKSTNRKTGMNFDKKGFDSLMKTKNYDSLIKTKSKAKSGGSFPDLNKDGKITKADILKGRGVIAKHGTKMMKSGGKTAKKK